MQFAKPAKRWVPVAYNDPRLKMSPCCNHPVVARTTTDEKSARIREASGGKNQGKLVRFDNQQCIYGQCQKCGDAIVRIRIVASEHGGPPRQQIEIWDYAMGINTGSVVLS